MTIWATSNDVHQCGIGNKQRLWSDCAYVTSAIYGSSQSDTAKSEVWMPCINEMDGLHITWQNSHIAGSHMTWLKHWIQMSEQTAKPDQDPHCLSAILMHYPVLQIRRHKRDNSGIIFHISTLKRRDPSLKWSGWEDSNKESQPMFSLRNKKNKLSLDNPQYPLLPAALITIQWKILISYYL